MGPIIVLPLENLNNSLHMAPYPPQKGATATGIPWLRLGIRRGLRPELAHDGGGLRPRRAGLDSCRVQVAVGCSTVDS